VQDPRLQQAVSDLVRQVIPHDYERTRDWGKTVDMVRGLYVKREGLRIKTHRTRKPVNHGTWTMYRVELIDPDEHFQIRWERSRPLPDQRLAFDLVCDARVRVFGRLAQWHQGIQLVSLSVESDADIQLMLQCELAPRVQWSRNALGLTLDPSVQAADLRIRQFRLRRISQLDGPLVKLLSSGVREVLEDEIAQRRHQLVSQVNRQLEKNQDKMHLSLTDLLETSRGWGDAREHGDQPVAETTRSQGG
jgi:hypothetical protein